MKTVEERTGEGKRGKKKWTALEEGKTEERTKREDRSEKNRG